jgi:hypothetical protein
MATADELIAERLARMRLGQAACDIIPLLSNPERRVAIVPLLEADYLNALKMVISYGVPDDTLAGRQYNDRKMQEAVLAMAVRELPPNLDQKMFKDTEQLSQALDDVDVTHIYDRYLEMSSRFSPMITSIPEEEYQTLKKVLQEINWKEASSQALYALHRLLKSVAPQLLLDSTLGSGSIKSWMEKNDESELVENVNDEQMSNVVNLAEN